MSESIEALTGKSREAILEDLLDSGRSVTPVEYIARTEISRLTARIAELAWQPIDTAPYSTPVEVRVGSMTFLARLEPDASLADDEKPCDQWQAVNEGEHPPCWSEGACWSSNTDEVMSRQPEAWRFARTTLEASERGTHNENLSR